MHETGITQITFLYQLLDNLRRILIAIMIIFWINTESKTKTLTTISSYVDH